MAPNPSKTKERIFFKDFVNANIDKPARYMGKELGVKEKNWDLAKVKWVLTYPELYEVGSSNLGHIILYSIINSLPGQLCDRAYLPGKDLAYKLKEKSLPLFAVETHKSLKSFDILGFSLGYELSATNILEMINLSRIAIYAKERENLPINDINSVPLIFAGGPTATSNPEPFAAFFDFFALGDGEELLPEISLVITKAKLQNIKRSELLDELACIPGIYVPSLYKISSDGITITPNNPQIPNRIIRRVASPIPYYSTGLVPNIETVHNRLTIEIRRGCTRGCRFCQPGMLTRPARDVDPNEVIETVENGMKLTGYSDFSLLSLSCSDYLALPAVGVEIKNRLADKNITLQLPSQRVDRFDENIAHIVGGIRKSGLTFAPEAGTQRLRDIVNKGLTDNDLLNGIRKAMEKGYRKIKLYFMIGLPGETDQDIIGIVETCKTLKLKTSDLGILSLNLTISNFTPKPHTPFQWHSVSRKEILRRQDLLKNAFKPIKTIKANFTDARLSSIEDFIGRGDRRIASVIEAAWRAGAGMDAWFERLEQTHEAWKSAIQEAGLNGNYRDLELGSWSLTKAMKKKDLKSFCAHPLPWDHIDTGLDKKWLAEDLLRALQGKTVDDCSFSSCSACGVCGPELGHNVIEESPIIPIQKATKPPNSNKCCRIRLQFSKTGPMALLSHLDIMRLLERSLRRSNLPISYTGGFHPLPRIKIALALPLGIEAFGEWMDLDFCEPIKAETVKIKLQKVLPEGFRILTCQSVSIKSKSLSQELDASYWGFELIAPENSPPNILEWEDSINNIMNFEQLIWHDMDKKGRPRKRDLKPYLRSIQIQNKPKFVSNSVHLITVHLELIASIDNLGCSLKPNQIQHFIEEQIGKPLKISSIQRHKLELRKC